MLMYPDYFQNWLYIGHGLLIFLLLVLLWLSKTGQIGGFWAFPGECMEGIWGFWAFSDQLQNWLDFGHALLNFLIMVPLWLSKAGHISGLQALSGQHLGLNVEGGTEAYFPHFALSSICIYIDTFLCISVFNDFIHLFSALEYLLSLFKYFVLPLPTGPDSF